MANRLSIGFACVPLLILMSSSPSGGAPDVEIQTILDFMDPVPGLLGTDTYFLAAETFPPPNRGGQTAFTVQFGTSAGVVVGSAFLVPDDMGSPVARLVLGQPVPGLFGGALVSWMKAVGIDDAGRAWAHVALEIGTGDPEVTADDRGAILRISRNGAIELILRESDPVSSLLPNAFVDSIFLESYLVHSGARIGPGGHAVFSAGIRQVDPGSGDTAFSSAVWRVSADGSLELLAAAGLQAPGTPNGTLLAGDIGRRYSGNGHGLQMATNGDAAFVAWLEPGTGDATVDSSMVLYRARVGGSLELVARAGRTPSGFGMGATLRRFLEFNLDGYGHIAFAGYVIDDPPTAKVISEGLYLADEWGTVERLRGTGDPILSMPGKIHLSFDGIGMNDQGQLFFSGQTTDVGIENPWIEPRQGHLWIWSLEDDHPEIIMGTGLVDPTGDLGVGVIQPGTVYGGVFPVGRPITDTGAVFVYGSVRTSDGEWIEMRPDFVVLPGTDPRPRKSDFRSSNASGQMVIRYEFGDAGSSQGEALARLIVPEPSLGVTIAFGALTLVRLGRQASKRARADPTVVA